MLEVAVIGDRVIARFDNTTLLDATVTGMATRGVAHISSAGLSFRDVEMASLEGIADPLKALGWEVPLNWQQATWSASEVAQKKIVVEDGWARIGQAAGALEKTWKLAVNGTPVSLGAGAVRLRYRFEGRALTLKIRNHTTYGYVTLWPSRLDLGIWSTAYAEREKRVQTRALATPLKDGEEGVLELAAAGRRLFARLNGSIVLTSEDLPDLGLTGGCEIQSDGVSFRDVEYASLHLLGGIFDPLKVLGWETEKDDSARESGTHRNSVTRTSIQWQEMAPDVSVTRYTHLAKNGEWYRILPPGGTFVLRHDESAPSFKNLAVRYRIRLLEDQSPALKVNLSSVNLDKSGNRNVSPLYLQLDDSEIVLNEGGQKETATLFSDMNQKGTEADVEFAIIHQVAYARINGQTIIVGPIQREGYGNHMSLQFAGGAANRAEFSKVGWAILDGIADPLKALGWEVPNAIGTDGNVWSDFFADWERSPDRNEFERTSLDHRPEGWQAARNESGANAYLVDSQGRDLALRVTAKFDLLRNPQDSDQITVRLRRTPRGLPNEYNEYAIYLFRSGQAYLRVIDDKGSRKLITAQLPSGFDPHQFHTLEISTNGRLISFLVDGQEMGTAEDETLPPGGRFGINGSQSVVFEKAEYRFLDAPKGNPASATKENPFVNTLGMKFVPVPITGGPTDKQRMLFSIWETRVQDYEVFVKETGHQGMKTPFTQGPTHPVICVSRDDAEAFCAWLTDRERKTGDLGVGLRYRLPSDHEWSCAVGIGEREDAAKSPKEKSEKINDVFPWGGNWPPLPSMENFSGEETVGHEVVPPQKFLVGYRDDFPKTAPVGSFQANRFGLFDLGGNAREWCDDWFEPEKQRRVLRGACFNIAERKMALSSYRDTVPFLNRYHSTSFRVVLAPVATSEGRAAAPSDAASSSSVMPLANEGLGRPSALPSAGSPSSATKNAPFINTLGMKFVPVPIGGPARSASPSDAGGGATDGKRVLFSVWVTRVKDYAAFAKAQEAAGMKVNTTWMRTEQDGVPVGREPDHPVVSMSWDDAQAFCQWLTGKEIASGKLTPGQRYRLPTDEEWSWAVGLPSEQGSTPEEKRRNNFADIFPWGTEWPPTTKVGNYADETFHAQFPPRKNEKDGRMENGWNEGYTDGFATTSPVGSFPANAYGLHDMGGNVWEWCEDWWNADNEARVRRGSSWRYFGRADMRSSGRSNNAPTVRISDIGFRCVLETAPSGTAAVSPSPSLPASSSPSSATKAAPFTNTLGMKFVPVPITGGPTDKQRVLFSVWETRVQDYEVFLKETKREWGKVPFEQGPTHPVVGPNWDDAQAFCDWLTETERKTGKLGTNERYRLPSDHEWSCAVDLGDKEDASKLPAEKHLKIADVFPWGTQWPPPKGAGNFAGEEMQPALASGKFSNIKGEMPGYHDGFVNTSPVGSFTANRFGLYDMGGNVWQWCADWADGSQKARVLRGSSSQDRDRMFLQSSFRNRYQPQAHMINHGFRVVLEAK